MDFNLEYIVSLLKYKRNVPATCIGQTVGPTSWHRALAAAGGHVTVTPLGSMAERAGPLAPVASPMDH